MKKLRQSGGYRDTASFQTATIIYDATVWFCEKFLDSRSRTVDQMIQAARSSRQNVAQGSRASASATGFPHRSVGSDRSSPKVPIVQFAHGPSHREKRQKYQAAILGLHEVSQLQRPPACLKVSAFEEWRTAAEHMSLAVDIVNPGDTGPEFVLAEPWSRPSGLGARIVCIFRINCISIIPIQLFRA